MEAEERELLKKRAETLRGDLKIWERNFALENGNRKATREEVKANSSIARKYSEYHKVRDRLAGNSNPLKSSSPATNANKRKHEDTKFTIPSKRPTLTPSKSVLHPSNIDPYDSPSIIRKLFSPAKPRTIGPTPQKDGQTLGLFDLLSEEDTPSKKDTVVAIGTQATPSKRTTTIDEVFSAHRHSRTPISSSKRYMLDSFLTPSKDKTIDAQSAQTSKSSVSKLNFFPATPSFLTRGGSRNRPLPAIEEAEDAGSISPGVMQPPKRTLVRGLSSILASLRRMEEEAADEDLDLLREMEGESGPRKPLQRPKHAEQVQVEDSQILEGPPVLLGGFDDEGMFDSEPEEKLGRDGRNLKEYKKKGQKRTTRRVNMKPVIHKPFSTRPQHSGADLDSDDDIDQHVPPDVDTTQTEQTEDVIGESQDMGFQADARNFDTDSSGSEYTASEGGTRRRRPNQLKKTIGEDGKKKTSRIKKVGALAQQNFKRLKLRNSGSKGGPGVGSRFRRKR